VEELVLVLDDQESVRQLLADSLAGEGRRILCEPLPADLVERVLDANPSLLVMDPASLAGDLPALMDELRRERPSLPVVILSSQADIERAVSAMRHGAFDYLLKPIPLDRLQSSLTMALDEHGADREMTERRRRFRTGDGMDFYKSASPAMAKVYDDALQVAMSLGTNALITGESGTGKEIVARLIHSLSPRHARAFMELNCASIPAELLESELFGHEAGAFTDAKESKQGLFEVADKGTILLDEIGEMSLNLQVKLLRFLERHTFRRVGGTRDIEVDVRIVSATNRDLKEMVKEGRFREDLYYRLNVVPIRLPALRERREDILPLIGYFLEQFNPRFNKNFRTVTENARRLLMEYPWPGNIRELRNIVERVVLMEQGPTVDEEMLRPLLGGGWEELPETFPRRLARILEEPIPEEGVDLERILGAVERQLIEKAYGQARGNQSRTADMLGLGRDKLRYRMKQHGLGREDGEP